MTHRKKKFVYNHHSFDAHFVCPLAGKGTRFYEEGYQLPKPLLPVQDNTLIEFTTKHFPKCHHYHFIKNSTFNSEVLRKFSPCSITDVNKTTDGQASSAYLAIKDIDDFAPIVVGVCDNAAVFDYELFKNYTQNYDVIFFSFTNHPNMKTAPSHYGWLDVNDKNEIEDVSVKKAISTTPLNDQAIVGIFYFKRAKYFKEAYQYLIDKNLRVNNEFYIDSMVKYFKGRVKMLAFPIEHFICLGTPNEYESFEYFKSCSKEIKSCEGFNSSTLL